MKKDVLQVKPYSLLPEVGKLSILSNDYSKKMVSILKARQYSNYGNDFLPNQNARLNSLCRKFGS